MKIDGIKQIVCIGPEWTNTHLAAMEVFGTEVRPTFKKSNIDALGALRRIIPEESAAVVAPIENSTSQGLVTDTMDFWLEVLEAGDTTIRVHAEHHMRVEHWLAVRRTGIEPTKVISHSQALAQSWRNLARAELPYAPVSSTADAARAVAESDPDDGLAALCSLRTCERYGLHPIRNMADRADNTTRFHIVRRWQKPPTPTGSDRTAIIVELENRPGASHYATGMFAAHGINLTSQHSISYGPGRYLHYFEAECHERDRVGAKAITCLRTLAIESRLLVLGSYPRSPLPTEGGVQ